MDNRNSKFGLIGFFLIVASLQATPIYIKYFLLTLAVISLVRVIYQYQKEFKNNRLSKSR
ncbi:hypothetical protein EV200_11231 [Pedobacter psychrotolerans]|uniref:Uncharacterized protein n=1 Tax=Pedobacter psychrotolerans TaxID=1843235 RepID=A0A4R2H1K4_9SPHI|nr:hypothetical protein [Pedobacter psychrotolerans]TCO18225.1 hypothetical protein EV200_11231 [Pedobacter psychrotolerans]